MYDPSCKKKYEKKYKKDIGIINVFILLCFHGCELFHEE